MPSEPARYGTARYGVARYTSKHALPSPDPKPQSSTRHMNNDELTNQMNMIDTAIKLAKSDPYAAVWQQQQPLAFGTDLAALETGLTAALDLAARAYSATTGPAQEKDLAEEALEELAFTVARALANHFKKTGDLVNRAKVNVRKSAITRLRDQALTTRTTEIRDLAQGAVGQPGAADRGITPALVTALTAAIAEFERLRNPPRAAIADRAALRRELRTDVAALMDDITDLDDLVLQFATTPAGTLFAAAWKQARVIVDAGHGPGEEEEPPSNPTSGGNPPTA